MLSARLNLLRLLSPVAVPRLKLQTCLGSKKKQFCSVHTTIGLDLLASIGGIVNCLFLIGACSGFSSLGWALINCQLFLGVLLGLSMLTEPIGSARIVVVWLLQMKCT